MNAFRLSVILASFAFTGCTCGEKQAAPQPGPSELDYAVETKLKDLRVKDNGNQFLAVYKETTVHPNGTHTKRTYEEPIDAADFEDLKNSIGMCVKSKPMGKTWDEANYTPHACGMTFVGNKRYGHWSRRSDGTRFWEWYGKYAFMSSLFFPRSYYGSGFYIRYGWYNNYYSHYRRGSIWYGPSARPWYGSRGYVSRSYLRSTYYGRNRGYSRYNSRISSRARTLRARSGRKTYRQRMRTRTSTRYQRNSSRYSNRRSNTGRRSNVNRNTTRQRSRTYNPNRNRKSNRYNTNRRQRNSNRYNRTHQRREHQQKRSVQQRNRYQRNSSRYNKPTRRTPTRRTPTRSRSRSRSRSRR
jgi:hypothetical protein